MTFARMTEDELSMHFNGVRCCLEVLTLSRVLPPSSFLCFYFVTFTFILHHVLHTATTRYSWAQRYLYLRLNTNLFGGPSSCRRVIMSSCDQTSDRHQTDALSHRTSHLNNPRLLCFQSQDMDLRHGSMWI